MATFGSTVTSGGSTLGSHASIAPNDHCVPQAGNDGISTVTWSPTANFLVSGNWDGNIRCWEVQEQNGQILSQPKANGRGEALYFSVFYC